MRQHAKNVYPLSKRVSRGTLLCPKLGACGLGRRLLVNVRCFFSLLTSRSARERVTRGRQAQFREAWFYLKLVFSTTIHFSCRQIERTWAPRQWVSDNPCDPWDSVTNDTCILDRSTGIIQFRSFCFLLWKSLTASDSLISLGPFILL